MEYGIAFVAGAIHKYYDDVQDTKQEVSPFFLELLKILMVSTMTILFMRNAGVSLFFLLLIAIYGSLGRIDSDVWKACVPIPFLTTALHWNEYSFSGTMDMLQKAAFVLLLGTIMYFEDGLVPEETSVRKSLIRIGFIGLALFFVWLYRNLPAISFVGPMLFFLIGYLVSNLVYHSSTLLTLQRQTKASQSTVLSTETMNTETQSKASEVLDSPLQDVEHIDVCDSDSVLSKSLEEK
jgi:hypothetical protein